MKLFPKNIQSPREPAFPAGGRRAQSAHARAVRLSMKEAKHRGTI